MATITGIADTLEKKELETSNAHPHDRRSLLVMLTEKGRAVLQSTPGLEMKFGSCCDMLSPWPVVPVPQLSKEQRRTRAGEFILAPAVQAACV